MKRKTDRPTPLPLIRPFWTGFINARLNEPDKTFTPQAFGFISPIDTTIYEDDTYAKRKRVGKGR